MYDVIIIGAGAAGITAAIYAARAKLNFLVISMDIGGLTLWSPDIENYPGYHNLSGIELFEKFKKHMKDYDIKIIEDAVEKVERKGNNLIVKTSEQTFNTKTAIVCSGSSPRRLDIPGANRLEGRGLAYCATCDAPLFAGKDVAIVGGGDSALAAALTLIQVVNKISILNLAPNLTGTDQELKKKVLESDKVEVINNAKATEILGEQAVTGIKYEKDGKEKTLNIQGVFVSIGHIRNTDFIKDLVELNKSKEIITDKTGAASQQGIFAAGDVTDLPGKQTIIACGDGSRALLSAFKYLTKK